MSIDMRKTIAPKSDQMNADDLVGRTMTIKVTNVTGNDSAEQPISIHFEGDGGKPFKPCKSMRRVMVHVWGFEAKNYVGRSMTLYCDPKVKFGGMEVGGIRISHVSHIDKPMTMALTSTRAQKKPFTVHPLVAGAQQESVPGPGAASTSTISEHDKIAKRIKKAIETSPDAGDLDALWNTDYADDLTALKKEKPDYWQRLKDQFDSRMKETQAAA